MRFNGEWAEEGFDQQERQPSPFRLHDFLHTIRTRKRSIFWSSMLVSVVALAVALLLKDDYDATAVILPPRPEQSLSALLSGPAAGLSSLSGSGALGGLSLGLKNPNQVYISLLSSRSLTTELVERFHLKQYYNKRTTVDAIKALLKHTNIELGKDDLIRITVRSHDAQFSSQLANAFVSSLHQINTTLALTDSGQRRLFFEQQLNQEKVLLAQAETALQETQSRTGILLPSGQAELQSRSISSLQAQITSREASLQSLNTYMTAENPQHLQLEAEISSLRGKLAQLENSQKTPMPGDIEVPTAQLPKSSLEYLRKYRDVQLHEQLYATLQKQLEAAKLDEARTAPVIQVVDQAVPAERSSGPYRWLIVLGAFLGTLLLNMLLCVAVYLKDVLKRESRVTR